MRRNRGSVLVLALSILVAACSDDDGGGGNLNNGNNDHQALCGNGAIEGAEECDDGAGNSDTAPDACRTDCRQAHCGDGVQDGDEPCDDGPGNSAVVPDACRPGCVEATCGDGVVDVASGETCDHSGTPTATCGESCQVVFCGNGVVEEGELCDDGPTPADPPCSPDCRARCGDGVRTGAEVCDGADLGDWSCASLGYYGGTATCSAACDEVAATGCAGRCGDGVRNGPEVCDGSDIPYGCPSFGYLRGAVGCTADCFTDLSGCEGYCGDGVMDPGEQCDGLDHGGLDCTSLGWSAGVVTCDAYCRQFTGDCHDYGWIQISGLPLMMGNLWAPDPDTILANLGTRIMRGALFPHLELGALGYWDLGMPYLRELWGSAPDDAFAVGDAGRILHYTGAPVPDGTTLYDPADWEPMASGTAVNLTGVWGASGSDVFAVGYGGTILHYDGATWTPMVSGTTQNLERVWGRASDEVYAVGGASNILHWNGSTWTSTAVSTWMSDVWGSEETGIWAVGGNTALHLEAGTWVARYTGTNEQWRAVGPSRVPGHVTVAGGINSGPGTRLMHCRTVCRMDPAPGENMLHRVSELPGYGPTLGGAGLWLQHSLGFERNWEAGAAGGAIQALHIVEPPGIGVGISQATLAEVGCLHVGGASYLGGGVGGIISHLGGDGLAVHGRAVAGDPTAVHALVVGEGGAICEYQGSCAGPSEIEECFAMTSPTTSALRGVVDLDETLAFAVGDGGTILRYDGTTWTSVTSPTTARLNAVWGLSSSEVHGIGEGGTVLRFDGATWSALTSPTTADLTHLWGSSATNVYAVGSDGTLLHYDGTAWELLPSPGGALFGLWGRSAREIYTYSTEPYRTGLLSFDGSGWYRALPGSAPGLVTLLSGSSATVYLSGTQLNLTEPVLGDFQVARPHWSGGDCRDPIPIYCQSRVHGDTDGATADLDAFPACAGLRDQPGQEVSYRLASPLAGTVTVRLTPHVADLDLVILGADDAARCDHEGACAGFSQGAGLAVEEVSVQATPGDLLYLVVDGPAAAGGAGYTLEVDCSRDL